ncbi:MAG: hypothetical protein R6W84_04170 [Promethearchaeia archaeon]
MTIEKVIEEIKNYNNSLEGVWKLNRRMRNIEEFIDFILDYFEMKEIKDRFHDDFLYPNERESYYRQKSENFNYIEHFLRHIKPFLLLAYRLSWNEDICKSLEEKNLTEESIENMIYNFTNLERTGRPRKFYEFELEAFQNFKKKYEKLKDFYEDKEEQERKSLMDYAKAIKKYNITKTYLHEFRIEFRHFKRKIDKCSQSTLYRYDKDLILFEKISYLVELLLDDYQHFEYIIQNKL